MELPLPRVPGFTKFHNPTRPSHLVGGALVRCRRAYSPSEIRSIRAVGLEQSLAFFSRRVRSLSRTPDREHRIEIKESCHQEGENLDLHPLEVDPDPLLDPLLILLQDPHLHQRKGVLNLCGSNR